VRPITRTLDGYVKIGNYGSVPNLMLILLFCLMAAHPATGEDLLEAWKREIEEFGGGAGGGGEDRRDAETKRLRIPEGTPQAGLLARILSDASLVEQFSRAHPLNVNHDGAQGTTSFILMNEELAGDWRGWRIAAGARVRPRVAAGAGMDFRARCRTRSGSRCSWSMSAHPETRPARYPARGLRAPARARHTTRLRDCIR